MMVFSLLLGMSEAVIKSLSFPVIGVPVPDSGIIVRLRIRHIKNADTVCEDPYMTKTDGSGRSAVLLRAAGDLKHEVLIAGYIGIAHPGPDRVTRNAGAAHIYLRR